MSELAKRTAFAVIAAPLAIVAIYFGDAVLATVLSVIAALAAWEFCRIARAAGGNPIDWIAIPAAAIVPLLVMGVYNRKISLTLTHIVLSILVVFATAMLNRGPEGKPLLSTATTVLAVIYVSMIAYIYPVRYHDYSTTALSGTVLVLLPIFATWGSDIGGYAFGRTIGGKKLIPRISPGKTIAGSLGGIALSLAVTWAYVTYALVPYAQLGFTVQGIVIFGVAISVIAQVGDLVESVIKREAGVKDSSTIIPGHGGILDRFDSLLFVMPSAVLLLKILLIPAFR